MSEPTEQPSQVLPPDLLTVARQLATEQLLAAPRVRDIVSSLTLAAPKTRTPPESFLAGYEEQMNVLQQAEQDGTLDILVEVGGSGDLNERIREVRTQRAVLQSVLRERDAANPHAALPGKGRSRRKNVSGRILEALLGDPQRLAWSAKLWAAFLQCSESSVKECKAWKTTIQTERAAERERRKRGPSVPARGADDD